MPDNHDDAAVPIELDHGSSLVWSTDQSKRVPILLEHSGGDVNTALKKLFGGSCSYEQAKVLAGRFAKDFGLTEGQFVYRYYRWRRNEL